MNNYANYLYIAIRAALDAGKAIMDIYTDPESDFGIERKADNSPLTKADKKAHAIISMALSVTPFPVLSEEGKRAFCRTFRLGHALDRRPVGRDEGVYQEKRRIYG